MDSPPPPDPPVLEVVEVWQVGVVVETGDDVLGRNVGQEKTMFGVALKCVCVCVCVCVCSPCVCVS